VVGCRRVLFFTVVDKRKISARPESCRSDRSKDLLTNADRESNLKVTGWRWLELANFDRAQRTLSKGQRSKGWKCHHSLLCKNGKISCRS